MTICFVTLGDIASIATMKRALGMALPLHALGWKVSIIAMDTSENRKRIAMECSEDVQVLYYQPGSAASEVRAKTQIVNQVMPDYLYFCSYSYRNRVIKGQLRYKPTIIVEHSELLSGIPDNKGARKLAMLLFEYQSIRYADFLICASKYLIRTYDRRAHQVFKGDIPVHYSPYGYSTARAKAAPSSELQERYEKNTILLYLGTMTRNYGLFTMLEAMKRVHERQEGIKLLLLGKGRHLAQAKQFVQDEQLDHIVEFLGYVPEEDIDAYFQLADAFISPLNDTVQDKARCPSKIYMYLPFQKPILTCPVGESLEIFGAGGYYFDNDRPDTLAGLIIDLTTFAHRQGSPSIEEHSWDKRALDFHRWLQQKTTYA